MLYCASSTERGKNAAEISVLSLPKQYNLPLTQNGAYLFPVSSEVQNKAIKRRQRVNEKKLFKELTKSQSEFIEEINRAENAAERARSAWACISAKSQRVEKTNFKTGGEYSVKTFENLTTITPVYERQSPISAGRDTGAGVFTFSKRSRQRMLNKSRMMKKEGLPLPYFVTLTYQENFKKFKIAKSHLNTFYQRFRRVNSDFRYFWKMEPQKRGAIHFHLAFFPPSGLFPPAWVDYVESNELCKESDIYVEYIRMRISSAWNEVSGQTGFTEIELAGEKEIIFDESKLVRSKNGRVFGNMALHAGTNVRTVENWRMFTAYVGKYMRKEVGSNPWDEGKKIISRHEINSMAGRKCVPVVLFDRVQNSRKEFYEQYFLGSTGELKERAKDSFKMEVIEREKRALHTGRWWGFSRNFDFTEIQSGLVAGDDLESMNDFCNTLNILTFNSISEYLVKAAERAKKELNGDSLQRRLTHLRNTYVSQKIRYEINKDKIQEGYSLQFEINHSKVRESWKYLQYQKINECPFLVNYYKTN